MARTAGGLTTEYVLDVGAALPEVIAAASGAGSTYYVQIQGQLLAQVEEGAWEYVLPDALGSLRQLADERGRVTLAQSFDPFGALLERAGSGRSDFGYTGEPYDQTTQLTFLRARYYDPAMGRFLSRDPVVLHVQQSGGANGFVYVGNNPVNYVDPTGLWRWYWTGSVYHYEIEKYYEGSPFNPAKQLEYPIPGTPHRHADMFNSITGDVYEIEPWFLRNAGAVQVTGYVSDLEAAAIRGDLTDAYFGLPFDWNQTLFRVGTGLDWPGRLREKMPGFPLVDLVADYVGQGVVIYWLEPNAYTFLGTLPFLVPNKRLVRPPNWDPNRQVVYGPATAITVLEGCGYSLMIVGGAVIVVTVVEDIATGGVGTVDDVVTVPLGLLFINWGQQTAVLVPTEVP